MLIGGSARDILIGGRGSDRLVGNGGDDLLIAGYTVYDINDRAAINTAALLSLLAEWDRDRKYASRIANLRSGTGSMLAGSGIHLERGRTVFDDGLFDQLTGSAGQDWLWFDSIEDIVTDKKMDESVN
jgi:Ca2+-binding RTX toxin-like protein